MNTTQLSDKIHYIQENYPSKKEIHAIAKEAASEIIERGDESLNERRIEIKRMLEFLTAANKELEERALEEFEVEGYEQGQIVHGAKLEKAETGVRYNYSHSPKWNNINNEILKLTALREAHESLLKGIPEGATVQELDEITGEVLEVGPAPKQSKTIVKITL